MKYVTLIFLALLFSRSALANFGGASAARSVDRHNPAAGMCYSFPTNNGTISNQLSSVYSNSRGLSLNRSVVNPEILAGYCQHLSESLRPPSCAGEKLEQLRQKALASGPPAGMQDYCPNWRDFAHDKDRWHGFYQNLLAALAFHESRWRADAKGPVLPKSGQSAKGIFQLSVDSVRGYRCSCSEMRSDADIYNAQKNISCGADLAITLIHRHNEIGSGGGSRSRGLAAYFQPFRNIDNYKRRATQNAMQEYCSANAAPRRDEQIPPPALQRQPATASNGKKIPTNKKRPNLG